MTDEPPAAPMKPQDTTNFLLGQISGQVTTLQSSVDSHAASQASVNAANEVEHAKFRETLGVHATEIAILKDGKKSSQENKLTRIQLVGLWIGAPSGVAALLGVFAYINFNH